MSIEEKRLFVGIPIDETFKEEDEFLVIPTDLSVIERMVVIKENEIKAIASLEKPSLHLRVNSLYKAKEILPTNIEN